MKAAHAGLAAVCIVFVSCATGCSQAKLLRLAGPTIPTGEWSGRGYVVAYEFARNDKGDVPIKPIHQDALYDTNLRIDRRALFGHEAFAVEIRSERGKLLGSTDTETHVRMLLFPLKSLDKGGHLLSLAHLEYNPSTDRPDYEGHKDEILSRREFASASCVRIGAETCLQVHYLLPARKFRVTFADTFIFTNGQLLKTGKYASTADLPQQDDAADGGKITEVYWVERLDKIK